MIDIKDNTLLIEKIMAHFGWYKVKMVEFPVTRVETNISLVHEVNLSDKEIEDAINQIKQERSSQQEHQKRSRSRQTTKTSSSNSPKRTTRSKKEGEK